MAFYKSFFAVVIKENGFYVLSQRFLQHSSAEFDSFLRFL